MIKIIADISQNNIFLWLSKRKPVSLLLFTARKHFLTVLFMQKKSKTGYLSYLLPTAFVAIRFTPVSAMFVRMTSPR